MFKEKNIYCVVDHLKNQLKNLSDFSEVIDQYKKKSSSTFPTWSIIILSLAKNKSRLKTILYLYNFKITFLSSDSNSAPHSPCWVTLAESSGMYLKLNQEG